VTLPVIFRVPDDVFATATASLADPPVQLPTMVALAGDAEENVRSVTIKVELLCVTLAVKVTPLLKINVPVPALEISSQVTLAVIVTV
jgi:hypothetical protein